MRMNTLKTAFFLTLMSLLVIGVGMLLGGEQGMVIAFIFAIGMNFFTYWFSDKIVLAIYGAQPVSEHEAPRLHAIVERLAERARLPKPRIYIIPSHSPNAFATGRNPKHAAVAVTEGALRLLDEHELEGVLGHEMAHVAGRDILISTVAAVMASAIMMLVRFGPLFAGGRDDRNRGANPIIWLVLLIVAPIAALLIQMAISRSREYQADAVGARLAGSPDGLADALLRLQAASHRAPMDVNPASAHMFIVSPLRGRDIATLFSTHPPIEERVRRLREMV